MLSIVDRVAELPVEPSETEKKLETNRRMSTIAPNCFSNLRLVFGTFWPLTIIETGSNAFKNALPLCLAIA